MNFQRIYKKKSFEFSEINFPIFIKQISEHLKNLMKIKEIVNTNRNNSKKVLFRH